MSGIPPLHGSCSCGRNEYVVYMPEDSATTDLARVFFDSGSENRRHQAAPLTAWLRVPLDWYSSSTYSYYPDETHSSIRRTFTSPTAHASIPTVRRQFCGYCGTQLSSWNEHTRQEADFISLALGSLVGEDLDRLVDLGLLPDAEEEEEEDEGEGEEQQAVRDVIRTQPREEEAVRGFPWFETMVENSRLGRIKRRKGGHTSRDGRTKVEWEVVELDESAGEEGEAEPRAKKRKGNAGGGEDVQMGSS